MKYRLGYDYYWNVEKPFQYKGKIVSGANINVLFSPIFECTEDEYKKRDYYPEKLYQGEYLFRYCVPRFDSSIKKIILTPTVEAKNTAGRISFEIVDYELDVVGEPDVEIESSLPFELRGLIFMDPVKVTEEEFTELFSKYNFIDLQSTSYFGKRVDSSELREQGQVKKKK